jgi:hypothetical protein
MNSECVMLKVYVINDFYPLRNYGLYCVQVYPYTSTKVKYTSTIIVQVYTNMCIYLCENIWEMRYTQMTM